MKLSHQDRVVEKIALLLLTLEPNHFEPDRTFEIATNDAVQMAYRANRAKTDPTWWEIVGRPHWNARMAQLRTKLSKQKK